MEQQVQATETPTQPTETTETESYREVNLTKGDEPNVNASSDEKSSEKKDNKEKLAAVKELSADMDDYIVKFVIDGEPKEMTVREMKKLTSLEQASQKRFQQATEITKKAQDFWERMQDPEEFFKYKKMDPVQFAEAKLRAAIEEAEMSPAQKEARDKEAKLKAKEAEIENFYEQRAKEEIDRGIGEAFQKVKLPKSPFLISKIAATVAQSLDRAKSDGGEPLSYEEAAVKVKTWYQNGLRSTMADLPPEEMIEYLGKESVEKLRQHLLAQVKGPATAKGPAQAVPNSGDSSSKPKHKKVLRNASDWDAFLADTLK